MTGCYEKTHGRQADFWKVSSDAQTLDRPLRWWIDERDVEAVRVIVAIADTIALVAALDGAAAGRAHSLDRIVSRQIHGRPS
jgi:hypothetical protein